MIQDIKHKVGANWVTFAAGITSVNVGEPVLMTLTHNVGEIAKVRLTEISDGLHPIELIPEGSDYIEDTNGIDLEEVIFKPVSITSPGRYIMSAWLESLMYTSVAKSIYEHDTPVVKFLRVDSLSVAHIDNIGTLVGFSVTNVSLFTITSRVELVLRGKVIASELAQWCVGESKLFTTLINSIEGEHTASVLIYDSNTTELVWETTKQFIEQDKIILEALVVKD